MKIGILSMQKVINFGSFLQAYALKRTLESLGHEVKFIDIEKGYQIIKRNSEGVRPKLLDKHFIRRIEHYLFKKKRKYNFVEKYYHWLTADSPVRSEECDCVLIGSDEVFNCCNPSAWGVTPQLFGAVGVPAFSYAGSFGFTNYEGIKRYGLEKFIEEPLKSMKAISVRDNNSVKCIQQLIGIVPQCHLDPVFLYDYQAEVEKQRRYRNYILVYAYDNRISDDTEITAIKRFARKCGKKLISFGMYQRWCDVNVTCSPFELLAYFDSADYVITDTFHGTVLSIKRNKQFAVIIRDSNRNKLSDLLNRFGLISRTIEDLNCLNEILADEINYQGVNEFIEQEKKRAVTYIKGVLND